MSDRKLVDLNDKWALTADNLQWMIARKRGDALQARRFLCNKKSIIQTIDASEGTDTIFIGEITEEAQRFLEALPATHREWLESNPEAARNGRGRGRRPDDATPPEGSSSVPTSDGGPAPEQPRLDEQERRPVDQARSPEGPAAEVASPVADPVAALEPNLFVADARLEKGIVFIRYGERQEDGGILVREAKVRPLKIEAEDDILVRRTRAAWMKKKEREGAMVKIVSTLDELTKEAAMCD